MSEPPKSLRERLSLDLAGKPYGGPTGGGGRRKRQTDRKSRVLPVCSGTIGHRPLRGRCPKKISLAKEKKSQNRGFLIKWVSALSEAFILFSLILSNLNNDNNNSKNNNNNNNNNNRNNKSNNSNRKI